MSAISRDYGVTPPAISYIVKNTPPSAAAASLEKPGEEAVSGNTAEAVASDSQAAGGTEAPSAAVVGSDEAAGEADSAEERSAGASADSTEGMEAAGYTDPLAVRLDEASRHCCRLVEAASEDAGKPEAEALSQAMHEVRRALVAIELDFSRRERKPRAATGASAAQALRPRASAAEPLPDAQAGQSRQQPLGLAANDESAGFFSGTVKFYRPDKGFGFVTPDDGSSDVYIPSKILESLGIDRLHKGQRVQLRRRQGARGPEVEELRLLAS